MATLASWKKRCPWCHGTGAETLAYTGKGVESGACNHCTDGFVYGKTEVQEEITSTEQVNNG
jgi:hypothetical protein